MKKGKRKKQEISENQNEKQFNESQKCMNANKIYYDKMFSFVK
jgi:hypothetical protein